MGQKIQTTLLFLFLCGFAACAGTTNGALPQSSLPPAQNCSGGGGCISVTGADSRGYVTVTGSTGAVPNSAVVILSVASSTSLNLNNFTDTFIASAQAQTTSCSSDLPTCTDSLEASSCQIAAETDGSFSATIKAQDEQTISVSYLDSTDNCKESEPFEQTIKKTVLRLAQQAFSMSNDNYSEAYVLGRDENGANLVDVIDLDLEGERKPLVDYRFYIDDEIPGTPRQILAMPYSLKQLVLTDQKTAMVSFDTNTEELIVEDITIDGTNSTSFKKAAVQRFFAIPNVENYPSLTCLTGNQDQGQYVDRVLLSQENSELTDIIGDITPIKILNFTGVAASDTNTGENITYNFQSYFDARPESLSTFSGGTLVSVEDIFVTKNNAQAFFIGGFALPNNTSQLALIEIPLGVDQLCSSDLTRNFSSSPNLIIIPIPQEIQNVGSSYMMGGNNYLMITDPINEKIAVINFQGSNNDGGATLLDDLTETDSNLSMILPFDFEVSSNLEFIGLADNTYLRNYSLNTDLDFSRGSKTAFLGLNPMQLDYLMSFALDRGDTIEELLALQNNFDLGAQLLVLDDDLPDDFYSTFKIIEVSEIE